MSEDRIQAILTECQAAATSALKAKQRELTEANPDLAEELQRHFSDGQPAEVDATVTFGKPESVTAARSPADPNATLAHSPAKQSSTGPPRFGDYELLDEIAKGGMGVVYRARQVELDRIVALKMIRTGGLTDQQDVDRFRVEAQAAAKLKHRGILPVYDVGEARNQHYFTMELADGGSLMDRLRDDVLPPRDAAEIVRKVAEAIQHAHDQGKESCTAT